jgi:hypothetical protein
MEIFMVMSGSYRSSGQADGNNRPALAMWPARVGEIHNDGASIARESKEKAAPRQQSTLHRFHDTTKRRLLVVLGLEDFTTTIEAVRADVVTHMRFTRRRLDTELRSNQEIVRTVHAALGWGLLILLNCHDDS